MSAAAIPLLSIANLEATYDHAIVALRGVTLHVDQGEIVALLGANGAGKTTTLKAISRLLTAERGQITVGEIRLDGAPTASIDAAALVRKGVVQVLEGRHCFKHLTVEENLIAGAFGRTVGRAELARNLERIYGFFPRLKDRRRTASGLTSGGEQQMTAIGRALMARPRLIVLDEPSMGLAPLIVEEIFSTLKSLNAQDGVTLLVAEQNSAVALRHADRAYVLENGRVVLEGPAAALRDRDDVKGFYLGAADDGESLRDRRIRRRVTFGQGWHL